MNKPNKSQISQIINNIAQDILLSDDSLQYVRVKYVKTRNIMKVIFPTMPNISSYKIINIMWQYQLLNFEFYIQKQPNTKMQFLGEIIWEKNKS